MKCLYEMKKKELLVEAIRMRQALIKIANVDFDLTYLPFKDPYCSIVGSMVDCARSALDPEPLPFISHLDRIYGLDGDE